MTQTTVPDTLSTDGLTSIADPLTRAKAANRLAVELETCSLERDALLYIASDKYGTYKGWRAAAIETTGISPALWGRIMSRRDTPLPLEGRRRPLPKLTREQIPATEDAILARIRELHQAVLLRPAVLKVRDQALTKLFPHKGNTALAQETGMDHTTISHLRIKWRRDGGH